MDMPELQLESGEDGSELKHNGNEGEAETSRALGQYTVEKQNAPRESSLIHNDYQGGQYHWKQLGGHSIAEPLKNQRVTKHNNIEEEHTAGTPDSENRLEPTDWMLDGHRDSSGDETTPQTQNRTRHTPDTDSDMHTPQPRRLLRSMDKDHTANPQTPPEHPEMLAEGHTQSTTPSPHKSLGTQHTPRLQHTAVDGERLDDILTPSETSTQTTALSEPLGTAFGPVGSPEQGATPALHQMTQKGRGETQVTQNKPQDTTMTRYGTGDARDHLNQKRKKKAALTNCKKTDNRRRQPPIKQPRNWNSSTLADQIAIQGEEAYSPTSLTNKMLDDITTAGAFVDASVLQRFAELKNTQFSHVKGHDVWWIGPQTAEAINRGTRMTSKALYKATTIVALLQQPAHFAACYATQREPPTLRDTIKGNRSRAKELTKTLFQKIAVFNEEWKYTSQQPVQVHDTKAQSKTGNDCAALAAANAQAMVDGRLESACPKRSMEYRLTLAHAVVNSTTGPRTFHSQEQGEEPGPNLGRKWW